MSYPIAELDRRLAAMIQLGTVDEVRPTRPPRCRVRVGDWVSPWVMWQSMAAGKVRSWRPPSLGEQAVLLCPSGDPAVGVALVGFPSDQHDQSPDDDLDVTSDQWPDGARESYNHETGQWLIELPAHARFVIRIGEAEFELTAAGSSLTGAQHLVNGNQSVSGDQQVAGNIEAGGTIMDGAGNSNNHTH